MARPPAGAFGRPTPAGVRATSPNPTPRQQTLGGSAVVDQRQPQNGPAILKGNPPQRSDQHPLGPPAERAHVIEHPDRQQHRPQIHRIDELGDQGAQQACAPGAKGSAARFSEGGRQHGKRGQE